MNTLYRNRAPRLLIALLMATTFGSATNVGAAQFIDIGTPTPSSESASGGDWGNLWPGRNTDDVASAPSAIEGDVYVLPSSGVEIVIGSGVTTDTSADSDVPDQIIVETDAGLGAIAVLDGFGTPANVLKTYMTGFGETMDSVVEVDVQSTADVATGVYRVETSGLTLYLFISVDASAVSNYTVIEVAIADAVDMESTLVQIRENVQINGVPAFANVTDEDVLQIIELDEG